MDFVAVVQLLDLVMILVGFEAVSRHFLKQTGLNLACMGVMVYFQARSRPGEVGRESFGV